MSVQLAPPVLKMKTCSDCKTEKEESEYHLNKSKPDGLKTYCKDCARKYNREYYKTHAEHMKNIILIGARKRREKRHTQFLNYLEDKYCVDCGETDSIVLEFDHLTDKERGVSNMVQTGYSWKAILKEIEKCEIVCCNCHRRRTLTRLTKCYKIIK